MTTCAEWCGCLSADQPRQSSSYMTALPSDNRLHAFCSCDCMLAGRPLHPVSRPPGELPACPTCDKYKLDHTKVHARPGSALPLPGPPDTPLSRFAVFALMHNPDVNPSKRGDVVWEELCRLTRERDAYRNAKAENDERFMTERDEARRDLAEARTALAEAKELERIEVKRSNGWRAECHERERERDEARARLAVTVGALEAATALLNRYRNRQYLGVDLDTDLFLRALAPTGAPPAKETP